MNTFIVYLGVVEPGHSYPANITYDEMIARNGMFRRLFIYGI